MLLTLGSASDADHPPLASRHRAAPSLFSYRYYCLFYKTVFVYLSRVRGRVVPVRAKGSTCTLDAC
jgi:hypothetical protein